jgi:hypothetical protein
MMWKRMESLGVAGEANPDAGEKRGAKGNCRVLLISETD